MPEADTPTSSTTVCLDPRDEAQAGAFDAMAIKCLKRHVAYSGTGRPVLGERYYDAAQLARQAAARIRGEIGA